MNDFTDLALFGAGVLAGALSVALLWIGISWVLRPDDQGKG